MRVWLAVVIGLLAGGAAPPGDPCSRVDCGGWDFAPASEPPTPGGGEGGQGQQPYAGQPKPASARGYHGSDEAPLVVKVAPPPGAYPESEDAREDRIKKATDDHRTFIAVVATAAATIALVIATALLWFATYGLYRTTTKAPEDSKVASGAAQSAAKAATDHVGETAKMAEAMNRAAEAMRDSVTLARDDFHATHRARLKLRMFRLIDKHVGAPIAARFVLFNVGETEARLEMVNALHGINSKDQHEPFGSMVCGFPVGEIIPPDGVVGVYLRSEKLLPDEEGLNARMPGGKIAIYGTVAYTDKRGITRRTEFDREFNPASVDSIGYPIPGSEID